MSVTRLSLLDLPDPRIQADRMLLCNWITGAFLQSKRWRRILPAESRFGEGPSGYLDPLVSLP